MYYYKISSALRKRHYDQFSHLCETQQANIAKHHRPESFGAISAHTTQRAAHFTREMDRLWRGAELGINGRLARKLAANRRRCGSGVRRSQPAIQTTEKP